MILINRLAQLLCVVVLACGGPSLLCHLQSSEPGRRMSGPDTVSESGRRNNFSPEHAHYVLKRDQINWVLIGNSMLKSRIDTALLSAVSGWRADSVAEGGTQSAHWFLFLKEVAAKADPKPALVTVFFRETDLTWPDLRLTGVNESLLESMNATAQPEWQQVIRSKEGSGATQAIGRCLTAAFPTEWLNHEARENVQTRCFRLTRVGTEMNATQRRAEMNQRFSLAHLRHDLGSDLAQVEAGAASGSADEAFYQRGPTAFDPSPDHSFLPHMVRVAREQGIRLHFHRIKRRPGEDGAPLREPAYLQRYVSDLAAWLKGQGCAFTDENPAPAPILEMYADGDHISADKSVQQRYIDIFWQRVKPVVGAPPSR